MMLGDDEHCWSPTGVFNIEGGCYAKTIDLSKEKEPEIYNAIKYGAIMENVLFKNLKKKELLIITTLVLLKIQEFLIL